jgi:hypothetical protein
MFPAEGDGTKVYASCLSFYDRVPHALGTKHEDLLGAVALKAICLLSHQPYLTTADKASGAAQTAPGSTSSISSISSSSRRAALGRACTSAGGCAGPATCICTLRQ